MTVSVGPEDLPGFKAPRVGLRACGKASTSDREVSRDGQTLCRACAGERYYQPA